MNFLALVFAIALQQLPVPRAAVQRDGWYARWLHWLRARRWPPPLRASLAVLGPSCLALVALRLVDGWLFGLLALAAAVALLLYALGRGDFGALLVRLRTQAASDDAEAVWLTAAAVLPALDEGAGRLDEAAALSRVRDALVYEAFQRWYAPLFFFLLAGPVAALAYRLLQLTAADSAAARGALAVADWLPARLTGFTFALTGDFAAAGSALEPGERPARTLLGDCARRALAGAGRGALTGPVFARELDALSRLLTRSAGAWLLLVSLGFLLL